MSRYRPMAVMRDDGAAFETTKDAAADAGVDVTEICRAVRTGSKCRGYRYRRLTDDEKAEAVFLRPKKPEKAPAKTCSTCLKWRRVSSSLGRCSDGCHSAPTDTCARYK